MSDPSGRTGRDPVEPPMDLRHPAPAARRTRFWPEISGALALGLSALAAGVLAFQIIAWARRLPGPGLPTVGGHILAAALAVLVQRFADRLRGRWAAAAVLGVLVITGLALWTFWWS